jgi:hypothetical protein
MGPAAGFALRGRKSIGPGLAAGAAGAQEYRTSEKVLGSLDSWPVAR